MIKNKITSQNKSLLQLVGESSSFKHRGPLVKPDITLLGVNESCGDKIVLQLQIQKSKISQAHFEGESCSLSALGAETVCQLLEKTRSLGPIPEKTFLHAFNFDFSSARKKCAYLIWHTWENYVSQQQTKKKGVVSRK
ncbi:MAG: iron-sulfur cluster assembly scaffold protein [Candidatus Parcubacteria bacterium]|nr:iron-sulfur cluster assembly scaffold protein [Candidatus Parcubacteria bacterium]